MSENKWPNASRCAAALTFDMDGECTAFNYDPENAMRRLSLQSEAAYGPEIGMPRLLDLLEEHGIHATIFIPGFTAERHEDLVREIKQKGHEIGHHGYIHKRPDSLTDEEEEQVLEKGIRIIENLTGEKPIGYRSPAWEIKPTTPELLKRHGIVYDSSLMGDDEPYLIDAGEKDRLVEIPVSWINDDWPQFGFSGMPPLGTGISSPQKVFELWSEEFRGFHKYGGCYVFTAHPFVIGRPSRMLLLERLIRFIEDYGDVWWATLGEIADHALSNGKIRYRPPADMKSR
jgi:peptidoglycan/xylan/chitin deacetylase (PgdA/CDA1 family)